MPEDDERADEPTEEAQATDGDGADGGYGLGRLLALSDGVFAIAMTLLVLSIPIPELGDHPPEWRGGGGGTRPGAQPDGVRGQLRDRRQLLDRAPPHLSSRRARG